MDLNMLVFSKTAGFRHGSISNGQAAFEQMAMEQGFAVEFTEDANTFSTESLQAYQVVVFLNTTGDILNEAQQLAFQQWYRAGGGFIGIHSAADTEYGWPWYNQLLGAWFDGHPRIQEAEIEVIDTTHISVQHLARRWRRSDEWYNYRSIQPHINPLLNLDESTYQGGTMGPSHPISWYHEFEGGRVFYTGMGHTGSTYEEPDFLAHLWGGIQYVAQLDQATGQRIQVKALLQGPFVGEGMRSDIYDLLPLTDPYLGSVSADSIPLDVVDWVLIQLRDPVDPTVIIDQQPGFLHASGKLVDTAGIEGVMFPGSLPDSAFIALLHRNHLGIMTAQAVDIRQLLDFSDTTVAVRGNDSRQVIGDKAVLFVGDYDGNGIINNQDFNLWKQNSALLSEYVPIDGDANGIVNNQDFNLWRANGSKIGIPELY